MDDIQESISSLTSSIDTLGIYIGQIDSVFLEIGKKPMEDGEVLGH